MVNHSGQRQNFGVDGSKIDIFSLSVFQMYSFFIFQCTDLKTFCMFGVIQGEKLQHKPINNQMHVCNVAWHPSRKIVAVGWQNGEIVIWNEQERELIEPPHLHKGEITILHWSSSGSRFVSGDNVSILPWMVCTWGG